MYRNTVSRQHAYFKAGIWLALHSSSVKQGYTAWKKWPVDIYGYWEGNKAVQIYLRIRTIEVFLLKFTMFTMQITEYCHIYIYDIKQYN
jgi:hypothetical protein